MKIRWLIVALCVMAPNCFAQAESPDLLAADNNAARFRTGEIDPLLTGRSNVTWPDVFSNPRVNLPRLVELLKQNVWNDYHLVKRIHDWLTLYIAYDNDFFYGLGTGTRKPDEFLPLKRTVCGGFAALFVEMCGLAGLQAEYVSGVARSYVGADGDLGGHAWNAVKISGTWYLVDVTHDHRRTYEHGTFGELGPYRDTELFIRPEAKILENLPDESRFQFLTRPRSREEFLRPPRLKVDAVGLGVGWPKQQFESLIRSGKRAREGGKMYSYFDEVSPGRSVVTLRFTHPEWVEMWVNLYDDAEQKHPLHAFISRTADGSEILCSVPGNGRFQVKVSARPSGGEAAWRLVYAFAVIGKNGAGPIVPPPGVVYTRDPFLRYKLEILDQDIDKPFGRGYYRLRIRHPDGVAVGSALRDKDDTNVEGAARVYVTGNVRDYYYAPPGPGTFFIKVFAGSPDMEMKPTACVIRIESKLSAGAPLPPAGRFLVREYFAEFHLKLIEENVAAAGPEEVRVVKVRAPADVVVAGDIRDEAGNKQRPYYVYAREGEVWTLRFSPPGKGRWYARIYAKREEDERYDHTAAEFVIESEGAAGPVLR